MTEEEWRRMCKDVRDAMGKYVWPFVTPILRETSPDHAQLHGTGNYIRIWGASYLLTAEHVIRQAEGSPLFHQPNPPEEYLELEHQIHVEGWPIDAALMRVGPEWNGEGKQTLRADKFDEIYSPVEGELLFLLGFPGTTAPRKVQPAIIHVRHTWFGSIETEGKPFLGQQVREARPVDQYDATRHIQVHYPERAFREVSGPEVPVPNLMGMSGSLLWDTKFQACRLGGQQWTPDKARVCGLVWGDNYHAELVLTTKIEYVRPFLLQWLREERAHLHWEDRDEPLWEQLVDWNWAEETFPKLSSG